MGWLRGVGRGGVVGAMLAMLLSSIAGAAQYRVDLIQLEPWAFVGPESSAPEPFSGIIVELLREFEKRSGHTTRKTLAPYLRVERDLATAQTDFTIIARDDARAAYASKGVVIVPLDEAAVNAVFGAMAEDGTVGKIVDKWPK